MKKILALAFAAATIFSVSASAQNNCDSKNACGNKNECVNKECVNKDCKNKDCKNKDCKNDRKCDRKSCSNPFEGLNLTADQQTRLKAISCPATVMSEVRKGGFDKDVNPRDLAKSVRTDYLRQVKEVLTDAQYTQFLENYFVNQAPARNGKDFKKGDRRGNDCRHNAPKCNNESK